MRPNNYDRAQLTTELGETRTCLREALETIEAIRRGNVDALVKTSGENGGIFPISRQLFPERAHFDQYRILLDSVGEGAVMIVPDGTILYCNVPFAYLVRRPLETVVGSDFRDFLDPDDVQRFEALLERARQGFAREEFTLTTADASHMAVQLSLRFAPIGDLSWTCMVVTDLTEQKRTQERLRSFNTELKRRAAQLIEGSVDAVLATDLEFRIIDVNQRMSEVSGFTRDELIGTQWPLLAVDPERALECMRNTIAQGTLRDQELDLRHKDGSPLPVAINARTFKAGSDNSLSVFVALRDMAERRSLDRERALLASIVASSPDAILSLTPELMVTSWNEGAQELLGLTQAEAIGRSFIQCVPLDSQAELQKCIRDVLRDRSVQRFDGRFRRKDQRSVEVSISLAPLVDRTGAVEGVALIARKTSGGKLSESVPIALPTVHFTPGLIASIGHELLRPLSSLTGKTTLLLASSLTDQQRRYGRDIQEDAAIVFDAVSNVLDCSRLSDGNLPLEQLDFELQAVADEALKLASGSNLSNRHEITLSISPDVPQRLRGDARRLRRSLSILLNTAAQISTGSAISLRALDVGGAPGEVMLRFEICTAAPPYNVTAPQLRDFVSETKPAVMLDAGAMFLLMVRKLAELMGGTTGTLSSPEGDLTLWFTATFARQTATDYA